MTKNIKTIEQEKKVYDAYGVDTFADHILFELRGIHPQTLSAYQSLSVQSARPPDVCGGCHLRGFGFFTCRYSCQQNRLAERQRMFPSHLSRRPLVFHVG